MSKGDGAIAIGCFAVVFLVILGVRINNPDITETQLFLTFWWLWLALVGFVLVVLGLLGRE